MKDTHELGDIGEMRIAFEATKRGYAVSVPVGHDTRYDLIVDRNNKLERIQVKAVRSDGEVITVRARSIGKHNGQVIAKKYTLEDIDWIAVFDMTTDQCFYVPATELARGRYTLTLRLKPSKNKQTKNIRWAKAYAEW